MVENMDQRHIKIYNFKIVIKIVQFVLKLSFLKLYRL